MRTQIQHHLPPLPTSYSPYPATNAATAFPGVDDSQRSRLFGGLSSTTVGRPGQYDQMFFQMQLLRQRNEAHDLQMAGKNTSRSGTRLYPAPPPFGASGTLDHGFLPGQGHFSMVGTVTIFLCMMASDVCVAIS